jgi:UPF0755 protein
MLKLVEKTILIVLALAVLVITIVLVSTWSWYQANTQPLSDSVDYQDFEIQSGATVNQVAQALEKEKLIRSALAFRIWHELSGDEVTIQVGSHQVSPHMDFPQIVREISGATKDSVRITLREGLRREQMAILLQKQLTPNFSSSDFLAQTIELEGQLFPDTYEFFADVDTSKVVETLHNNFIAKYNSIGAPQDPQAKQRLLTLASLVEREGKSSQDRRMIAGIISNRLEIGMKLDIDATLQYLADSQSQPEVFWSRPSPQLKEIDSPYNTYQVAGLPPTPICNPGLQSLQASFNPAESSYLYYLHASDNTAYYAQTYAQHQQNIDRYLR